MSEIPPGHRTAGSWSGSSNSCSMTTHSHSTWTDEGGHVTPNLRGLTPGGGAPGGASLSSQCHTHAALDRLDLRPMAALFAVLWVGWLGPLQAATLASLGQAAGGTGGAVEGPGNGRQEPPGLAAYHQTGGMAGTILRPVCRDGSDGHESAKAAIETSVCSSSGRRCWLA